MIEKISYCIFPENDEKRALSLIQDAKAVVLLPHTMADGDALSSCAAMEQVLLAQGKKVEIVAPDRPQNGVGLEIASLRVAEHSFKPDLLISLDVANKERSFMAPGFLGVPFINIDHHIQNTMFGDINLVEGGAASACEVLAVLLYRWFGPEVFTKKVAELLLFGILDDSITFRTQLTSKDTLTVSSFLMERGADFQVTKSKVARLMGLRRAKQWATLLNSAQEYSKGQVVVVVVSQALAKKYNYEDGVFGGFINYLNGMLSHDVVALLLEIEPGKVKGSLRSKRKDIATVVGNLFGGGGHTHAAGFLVSGSLREVERKLVSAL